MQPTRRARLEALIQQELSIVVPREVKDPRVPALTFTSVQVTPDGGLATVSLTLFGAGLTMAGELTEEEEAQHAKEMKDCLAGLASASGYLRRHLARVLTIRQVPILVFREDKGLANTMRVHELLKKISDNNG
jgi:ribosome-binding factor A